jgi:uncharacterized protein (TIGR02246 family)
MPATSVEDRLAIEDLFIRYTRAIDAGDVDTLTACFTEDGTLQSPVVGGYAGRKAIRAFAERFARYREGGAQFRHVISNFVVQVKGDRAHAGAYLLVFLTRNGATRTLPPAEYDCDLRRVDGAWLFDRRVVRHDCDYTLEGI